MHRQRPRRARPSPRRRRTGRGWRPAPGRRRRAAPRPCARGPRGLAGRRLTGGRGWRRSARAPALELRSPASAASVVGHDRDQQVVRAGRRRALNAHVGQQVEVEPGGHRDQRARRRRAVPASAALICIRSDRVSVETRPGSRGVSRRRRDRGGLGARAGAAPSRPGRRDGRWRRATSTPCSRPAPEQCPTASSAPAARGSAPAAGSSVAVGRRRSSTSSSCGMHSPAAAWRSSAGRDGGGGVGRGRESPPRQASPASGEPSADQRDQGAGQHVVAGRGQAGAAAEQPGHGRVRALARRPAPRPGRPRRRDPVRRAGRRPGRSATAPRRPGARAASRRGRAAAADATTGRPGTTVVTNREHARTHSRDRALRQLRWEGFRLDDQSRTAPGPRRPRRDRSWCGRGRRPG